MNIINFDAKKTKKKYNLLPFLPPPPFRCIISGNSGCGKTNLLVNMMTHKEGYKQCFRPADIILISSTLGLDDKLKMIAVKPENKFSKFDEAIVMDIMEQQHQLMSGKTKRKAPQILLLLDDLASESVYNNTDIMRKLAFKGRHYNISFICLTQKYNQISMKTINSIRANWRNTFINTNNSSPDMNSTAEQLRLRCTVNSGHSCFKPPVAVR